MKRMVVCFAVLISLLACSDGNGKKVSNEILSKLEKVSGKKTDQYKAILFVPSEGCGGCITAAEDFMIHSYAGKNKKGIYLFVVTGHSSSKSARIRLGPEVMANEDFYFDYDHNFDRPPFMSEYPKMFLMANGNVVSEQEIKPGTSDNIYKELAKKIE